MTHQAGVTPHLLLLRLCRKLMMTLTLKSVMKISKWTFTERRVQAVRRLIKLPLPFALLIYLQALLYRARLSEASTKTVRLRCVCLNQSLLKSRKEKTLKELKILRATKRKSLGEVKSVPTFLCRIQWLRTTERILKWAILPLLWTATSTVSLTLT